MGSNAKKTKLTPLKLTQASAKENKYEKDFKHISNLK